MSRDIGVQIGRDAKHEGSLLSLEFKVQAAGSNTLCWRVT
jgi:hypothetical protein